jgi:hypothetical protein
MSLIKLDCIRQPAGQQQISQTCQVRVNQPIVQDPVADLTGQSFNFSFYGNDPQRKERK